MTQFDKLKAAFVRCSGPFPWRDFEKLIGLLGYDLLKTSGGSARTYVHRRTKDIMRLHEPHDGTMGPAMVARLQKHLSELGLL